MFLIYIKRTMSMRDKKIKSFYEHQLSINESFRDVKKGMTLVELINHKSSYSDRVANCLIDIITRTRGISEKSFSRYDEVIKEVETFYEKNQPELSELINRFETNDWRPEYCAEEIYANYFKDISFK